MRLCVYIWIVVESMYICKTINCDCVCVFVVVEGMYTYKNGKFVNKPLCLCLCFCRGCVHV